MISYSAMHFYSIARTEDSPLLKYDEKGKKLKENCKSLVSVAGLRYNIHIDKAVRDGKLQILGLANGKAFDLKKEYTVVNVGALEVFENDTVITAELLLEAGIIGKIEAYGLKVLGDGNLTKKLTVKAAKFTAAAQEKIANVGGTAEVL